MRVAAAVFICHRHVSTVLDELDNLVPVRCRPAHKIKTNKEYSFFFFSRTTIDKGKVQAKLFDIASVLFHKEEIAVNVWVERRKVIDY